MKRETTYRVSNTSGRTNSLQGNTLGTAMALWSSVGYPVVPYTVYDIYDPAITSVCVVIEQRTYHRQVPLSAAVGQSRNPPQPATREAAVGPVGPHERPIGTSPDTDEHGKQVARLYKKTYGHSPHTASSISFPTGASLHERWDMSLRSLGDSYTSFPGR